jgi:hypothetical protein
MDKQPFINNKRLRRIRKNTDWRKVAAELQLELDKDRSNPDDLWANSPFADEKTASLHINNKGFYCHASKEKGGPIELVQKVLSKRTGKQVNCYQAGQWLLDHDLSSLDLPDNKEVKNEAEKSPEILENKPVRQNLIKSLSQIGTHPEFTKRDISEKACKYLGCGFFEGGKGVLKDRIVFQIRGVRYDKDGNLVPVILSHTGMATTKDQIQNGGKWLYYDTFNKDLEIFNIDNILFDPRAAGQVQG